MKHDNSGHRVYAEGDRGGKRRFDHLNNLRCDDTTRRTAWDGDQVLAEIRYPNGQADWDTGLDSLNLAAVAKRTATPTTPGGHAYGGPNTSNWAQSGRVLYVHAGGIDQPLGLLRMDYGMDFPAPTLIVPHASWRGAYEMGTFAFGETSNCHGVWMPANEVVQHDSSGHMAYPAEGSTADVNQDRCMEIDFPGKHMGMTRLLNRPTVAGPVAWMGSLVQDAQDASGLMYRRNRFYDPISSRFTQEDPIGLAGGVNSYGFAEGDPVNYRDPYGLTAEDGCDPPGTCLLRRTVQGAAVGAALGTTVAGACTVLTVGVCAAGPAELTIAGSAQIGALGGAAVGVGEELSDVARPAIDAGVHAMGRLGRLVRRATGSILLGIGVTTTTPTTESAGGDIPSQPTEAEAQGRRAPSKGKEKQRPPAS